MTTVLPGVEIINLGQLAPATLLDVYNLLKELVLHEIYREQLTCMSVSTYCSLHNLTLSYITSTVNCTRYSDLQWSRGWDFLCKLFFFNSVNMIQVFSTKYEALYIIYRYSIIYSQKVFFCLNNSVNRRHIFCLACNCEESL